MVGAVSRLLGALVSSLLFGACTLGVTGEVPPGELCDTEGDCAPSENPCRIARCPTGRCELVPLADGPGPSQTLGDCQITRCEGGEVVVLPDPNDNDDGDACTIDTCTDQGPTHATAPDGTVCTEGVLIGTCLAGVCDYECLTTSDCPTTACAAALCDMN